MYTPDHNRWVAALLSLVLWSVAGPAWAQLQVISSPHARVAASGVVSEFLTWVGDEQLDGLAVYTPADWQIMEAHVAGKTGQYQHTLDVRKGDQSGTWILSSQDVRILRDTSIRLTMQAPSSAAEVSIFSAPLIAGPNGYDVRRSWQVESRWNVVESPIASQNRALTLTGDADTAPRVIAGGDAAEGGNAWTMAWWLRSSGLDQIVVSTWTGNESDPYPIEAILDERGHLAVYTGREGQHYAMRSTRPLADGTWHHIAVAHHAGERKMRMLVDGVAQDSLQFSQDVIQSGSFSELRLGYRLLPTRPELSDPLYGDLDGIQIIARSLSANEIAALKSGTQMAEQDRILSMDFEPAGSREVADAGISPDRLVPSVLSFRRTASDLQVSDVPEGILLSFASGDDEILTYRIDVSEDGQAFRNEATLEPMVLDGGRVEWLDRSPRSAIRHYRVTAIYPDGPGQASPTIKMGLGTDAPSARVMLEGNFPNPFNPTTTIRYEVFEQERVRVSVWDLSGQMIAQPVDGPHAPGRYEVRFDAGKLPSGTYFVRLESLSGIQTHQMVLMK
jgi:hypothetical protein